MHDLDNYPEKPADCQRRLEDAAAVARRLAHDFGNILTGILGFSELALKHAPASSPLHRFVQETHRAAQEGAELTHQLQMFSCRRATRTRPARLSAAAEAEAVRLRPLLSPDVQLQVSVPADLPLLAIAEELLRTVLGQLLDNAREALTGPGMIGLSARPALVSKVECSGLLGSAEPGPCVEVCVSDTGTGLSPEARRHLFAQPFYSSKPRHRGLGLAMVYGILHAHGGGFRLESPPAGGTVARLYLPLAVGLAPTPLPAPPPGGGAKVLVVDDDPAVLRLVGATLASAGYQVQTVSCPVQALDSYTAAAREPFQLVLSDVRMPRMNGFDLARQLLRHDANANVLFMSGHAAPELTQASDIVRRFELLPKPFQAEALLRAVRTALDRGARRLSAGNGPPSEETIV
ncbi:MAG TPA: response regulator [Gemmataceae bacterium]|nr:response regulator [Gemmataceae bacterium]